MLTPTNKYLAAAALAVVVSLVPGGSGYKYHDFCSAPPLDMKTRFPLYRLDVDTKTNGIPWAYRQNNTLTVSVKALYQKYMIKRIFISVPSMTKGSPEVPAKRIHLGQWKWDMKGGVIPLDCSNPTGGFASSANAVRDLWWYRDGFFNVTAIWDPVNTIYNAYNVDLVQFTVYVSPDSPDNLPVGALGPKPNNRWVKLNSAKYVNMDYIDLHRWLRSVYGPYADIMMGNSNNNNNKNLFE